MSDGQCFSRCDIRYVTLVKANPPPPNSEAEGPVDAQNPQTARLELDTAFRVLRHAVRPDDSRLVQHGIPCRITVDAVCDLNKLAKFLAVAKFFDGKLISSGQDEFLFDNLRTVMLLCNDKMQDFVKKRCKTIEQVLKVLFDVGDDGNYDWIPRHLVCSLFVMLKSGDKDADAAMAKLSQQFLVFLFKHPFVVVKTNCQGFHVVEDNYSLLHEPSKRSLLHEPSKRRRL